MSVRLFVLGQVYEKDTHGYEIKEQAKLWGVERWANIGFGSIYHAISTLQAEEMILEQSVEQESGRPPGCLPDHAKRRRLFPFTPERDS